MNNRNDLTTVNREYKDTMFRLLFREKQELLQLYNAVNHSHYADADQLQVVTLENAIYMNMKNDLAFWVDCHLYLYEHQSTYNPNIPLRNLFYVAREYEKLVNDCSLFSSKLIRIPTPHFIVFYNGIQKQPERRELKLSDAYLCNDSIPELELKVTMLNINLGNNTELLEQCETLKQYLTYVELIRKYVKEPDTPLTEAVERAVNECIKNGILTDFLRKHKSEAISVSIFEYNEVEEKEKMRRAEHSVGLEEGLLIGRREGELINLILLTLKKYHKHLTVAETADMLETSTEVIDQIYRAIEIAGTDDIEEIHKILKSI